MRPLARALKARESKLPAQTNAFRWSDEDLPGVVIDRFDDVSVLNLYTEHTPAQEQALVREMEAVKPSRAIYVKRRPREARRAATVDAAQLAPVEPIHGTAVDSVPVKESGRRFEIRPANGISVGLYVDSREARDRVRAASEGKRVLNLFSYTCGFGIAALSGGATRAVNVDQSRKVLDWGAVNTELNGFQARTEDFIAGDAFDWLKRFAKKNEAFDLVILDPPGFATTTSSRFSAQRDYHRLVAGAAAVTAKRGRLLAMCNVEAMTVRDVEQHLRRGCAARRFSVLESFGASPVDCRQPSSLKCFVVQLD